MMKPKAIIAQKGGKLDEDVGKILGEGTEE